ncbi:MAG: UDP-N-acetylmuramate--L-alanine ligase [Candidatus Staskawiczbacteria bacterium]|nr:UDP-N-acetylmuramate--L-alanine ligase [Candidatus Staskawiczbacteria bacterium]
MKIHLIGIGGIGVSALAQYYISKGYQVSGSDLVESEITDLVREKGAKIFIGNSAENISTNINLVVYSPAVKPDNPEYKMAKELGIKIQTYPEALGELTKEFYTIAIAGAHGKSTTTAMAGLVLAGAGLDPTVIVGTRVKEFGDSNFRAGKSKLLVIEACEYDSSFLHYLPKIIAITNIDKEHLDYFKTFANVKKAFKNFVVRLPVDGHLVFNKDDKYPPKIVKPKFKIIGYSVKQKEAGRLKKILKVPGMHNVSNALAVLAVAKILNIPNRVAFGALSKFNGTWRRFEIKEGEADGKKITVISDYAHHPNEISATLKATRRKYPKEKIWCIFQPHQHQRTFYLFNDFVKTFQQTQDQCLVDNLIITDIYDVAGRETKKINSEVSAEKLVKKIDRKNVVYMPMAEIVKFIREKIGAGDVLIIMGAGDIYKLADKF